ncbi:transposase [Rhodobacterales bacterium HKCCE4037]|nr:transposase [Rhodobacterales bacterium HKCCE4037]
MPRYRRPFDPCRPVYFTVCLADRGSSALIDHLDILREAVRVTKADRPFEILAWGERRSAQRRAVQWTDRGANGRSPGVLPDHMHAVWRLPESDANFSQRWGRIKARFSRDARRAGLAAPCDGAGGGDGGTSPALRSGANRRAGFIPPTETPRKGEAGIWQRRFWEHHCRDDRDLEAHIRYCWLNPVKHGLVERPVDWAASSIHRDMRLGRMEPEWFV